MTGTNKEFNCKDAAHLLRFPAAEVGPCNELLPGLWRVVLKGSDVSPEGARIETFIWRDGARSTASGPSALAAYLKSIEAHGLKTVDAYAVQILLEATAGGPPGFAAGAVSGQIGDISGGVTTSPFGVTLVQAQWRAPVDLNAPPDAGQPPMPTSAGPLGPAPGSAPPRMAPPGSAPPGMAPPGGPPPGMGPPSGVAPPQVAKATLTLDADYRGAWLVAIRSPFAQTFQTALTVPVAP